MTVILLLGFYVQLYIAYKSYFEDLSSLQLRLGKSKERGNVFYDYM